MSKIKDETQASYKVTPNIKTLIDRALKAIHTELQNTDLFPDLENFSTPDIVKNYLTIELALEEREHFHCLFLDNQHRLLQDRRLFSGTIDAAAVYPREIVKAALQINAAAVIFAHNHPSGLCDPSQADKTITEKLKQALATVDIRVLDHVLVAKGATYSFAESGLL